MSFHILQTRIVFREACKLGCEGIFSKRLGSFYRSGRSPHWVKVKNPQAPAVKREAEEDWAALKKKPRFRGSCRHPLCQNPWHRASALAHGIAGAATDEGRGHRARQQDRQDGLGDHGLCDE